MKLRARRASGVLILSLLCLACGGGGGGNGGPTEPPPPTGKRFQFNVFASPIDGGLVEATLSLDGRQIARRDWPATTGSVCTILCGLPGDEQGLTPGNHTLTFTVVRQNRTTLEYIVNGSGVVTDLATGGQRAIVMPQQNPRLRAGQSVTFTVFL
jgi:hypothetical protein